MEMPQTNQMVAQPQTEQPVRITSPAAAKLCPSLGLWPSSRLGSQP